MREHTPTRNALLALLLLGILAGATPLRAQTSGATRSDPTGFVLGVHLNGSAISWEDADEIESGGGLGFLVGYAFNRTATLYLAADGASMSAEGEEDSYTLGLG